MKEPFKIKELIQRVHETLGSALSEEDIEALLDVGEDAYHRDNPKSLGKSLYIHSLEFSGVKRIKEKEEPFSYHRTFYPGVNMWVGDNLVGKSSIFKIIKLALTGRNTIMRDVGGWISEIGLIFKIGSNSFTSVIRRRNTNNFECILLNSGATLHQQTSNRDQIIFEGSLSAYETYMQDFFFQELNYYSLQWTQHKSQKEKAELSTANASWPTYFKSIYLEADDYNELFYGSQSELIFQMLLGLELTYPINRLKIKRNHLRNQLGVLRQAKQNATDNDEGAIQKLKDGLEKVKTELDALNQRAQEATTARSNPQEQQLEEFKRTYRQTQKRRDELEQQINTIQIQQNQLRRNYRLGQDKIEEYKIEITKKERAILDVEDYLQIGAFFQSLEVKTCPNCSHSIAKEKVHEEKATGHCRLCENDLLQEEIDATNYQGRLQQLQEQRDLLQRDLLTLQIQLEKVKQEGQQLTKTLAVLGEELAQQSLEPIQQQIHALSQQLTTATPFSWEDYRRRLTELTEQKAHLQLSLEPYVTLIANPDQRQARIGLEIKCLEIAEEVLKQERLARSQDTLRKLEKVYLNQLHSFDLAHYEKVEIKDDFRITYFKHATEFPFEEISPGEKLRAKLGLYISLIEMDAIYQLGRHPRFIILDSPGGEEADRFYIDGLRATLSIIQKQFGNSLQVFVGSATRELADSVTVERVEVKKEQEFFF